MTVKKWIGTAGVGATIALSAAAILGACAQNSAANTPRAAQKFAASEEKPKSSAPADKVVKTDAEWKKILTPAQYNVLREEGTERSYTGDLLEEHRKGTFVCAACGNPLFSSDTKFESGTGWPSFWQPLKGRVAEKTDEDGSRTEVECARCDGHLGHVFDDGPKPTGLRYCMNSVAMKFVPAN